MTETAEAPRYVHRPGGVIVHLKAGSSKTLAYGAEISDRPGAAASPDEIADYVDLSKFTDAQQRLPTVDVQVAEAQRRAALTDSGQPFSSVSPVPGNYSELDEDAAARLVENLAAWPEQQANVVLHEVLFGGKRQKVLDAAGPAAQMSVAAQLADIDVSAVTPASIPPGPVVSGAGDPQVHTPDSIQANAAALFKTPNPAGLTGPDRNVVTGQDTGGLGDNRTVESGLPAVESVPTGPGASADGAAASTELAETQAENERLKQELADLQQKVESDTVEDRHGDGQPTNGGLDWDDKDPENPSQNIWTKARLAAYAGMHGVEGVSGNRDDMIAALKAAGHEAPQSTPADVDAASAT